MGFYPVSILDASSHLSPLGAYGLLHQAQHPCQHFPGRLEALSFHCFVLKALIERRLGDLGLHARFFVVTVYGRGFKRKTPAHRVLFSPANHQKSLGTSCDKTFGTTKAFLAY